MGKFYSKLHKKSVELPDQIKSNNEPESAAVNKSLPLTRQFLYYGAF